jgi:hypothetical protein
VGLTGLLTGTMMGLVGGVAIAFANFLLVWVGMTVVSPFKTTKIQFEGARPRL